MVALMRRYPITVIRGHDYAILTLNAGGVTTICGNLEINKNTGWFPFGPTVKTKSSADTVQPLVPDPIGQEQFAVV